MKQKSCITLMLTCIFFPVYLFSQQKETDSLLVILKHTGQDTVRVNVLIQIAKAHYAARAFDLTGEYGQIALVLAQKLHYQKGEASAYGLVGRYHYKNNRDTMALQYFRPALKINLELGDFNETGQSYIDIANANYHHASYAEALKYAYLSLKVYEQARSTKMIGYVWIRIGFIEYYIKNYNEALNAFENAYKFARIAKDKKNEALAVKNIGVIYFIDAEAACSGGDTLTALKKCESSIVNYESALKMYEKIGESYGMMETYHPLGNSYEKIASIAKSRNNTLEAEKNMALAKKNFLAFLEGAEKFKDMNYTSEACYALGGFFIKQRNAREAEKYLRKGLQISIHIAMNQNIKTGYCHMAELYNISGDYKQAFNYQKLCADYTDSIVNDENKKKSLQLQMNYEVEKKEDQLKLLAAENKLQKEISNRSRGKKNLAYVGLALVLVTGAFGFYFFRKKKAVQNKQAMMNERLRISQELHDEVGATLSGIAMYSHLAKEQIKNTQTGAIQNSLNIIQSNASEMVNKLNDIVWLINPGQDSLQKLMQRLEDYAVQIAAVKNIRVKSNLNGHFAGNILSAETRRNIYLLFKEAINNAVKYSNATLLDLNVKEDNTAIKIALQDNGDGFNVNVVKHGNGLDNMQQRAKDMQTDCIIESVKGKGTSITVVIKIR
jgi:two-component system, NarL family, sensor histidine kinase UhpB